MYCRKCGAKLIDDSLFCPKCGTRVEGDGVQEKVAPSQSDSGKAEDSGKPDPKEADESGDLMFSPDDKPVSRSNSTSAPPQTGDSASTSGPAPAEKPPEPEPAGGDVELPPSLLPKPDGFKQSNEQELVEKDKKKKAKKIKKERRRWHPLDNYQPLKERFRMGGCGLAFLIFILIPLLIVGILGWIQYDTFVNQKGFEAVQQEETNIVEAPSDDAFFWSWKIWQGFLYEAPETDSEIAIVGGTWWLDGTFKEKVHFRGYQLILEDGARFEKGLDVTALRFDPGEAEIEGELTGRIAIQE